jgi:hypothetical protein
MRRHATPVLALAIHTFLILPVAPLWAQELSLPPDGDRVAPVLQYEPPTGTSPTGQPLKIDATITDNTEVLEAILFYRPLGASEYTSLPMDSLGQGRYRATIPGTGVVEPGVEYYIQASDRAGNMVMRGFAFSPLIVTVAPVLPGKELEEVGGTPQTVPTESPTERMAMKTEAETKPWYKKWWVWAIAGGVVVAAAAAGGGGGGGGDEGGAAGATTGSADISVPLP